ncbi:terminase family protein [Streptomyces sp900116325]|uniref:terminase large subunit domain-containing protein n=1 Tax=Streptomyces sp. 900116325 TaxID=3154295 RepID=UPI0033B74B27
MSLLDALPMSRKQLLSIVQSEARINVWEGSVRSGKTIASLLRWLIYVADAPRGGELVMVGRTRDSLFRNIIGPLMNPELFGELAGLVKYNNGAPMAYILGRPVHVLGANDAKAEPKVRGMTCTGAYVDELTTLPPHVLRSACRPVLRQGLEDLRDDQPRQPRALGAPRIPQAGRGRAPAVVALHPR